MRFATWWTSVLAAKKGVFVRLSVLPGFHSPLIGRSELRHNTFEADHCDTGNGNQQAEDHSGLRLDELPSLAWIIWQAPVEFHDNHHKFFHANYGAMVDWWDRNLSFLDFLKSFKLYFSGIFHNCKANWSARWSKIRIGDGNDLSPLSSGLGGTFYCPRKDGNIGLSEEEFRSARVLRKASKWNKPSWLLAV